MSLNNTLYRKLLSIKTEQLVLTWKNLVPFATVLRLVTQEERCVTSLRTASKKLRRRLGSTLQEAVSQTVVNYVFFKVSFFKNLSLLLTIIVTVIKPC